MPNNMGRNINIEQIKQEKMELQGAKKCLWKTRKSEEELQETGETKTIKTLDKRMGIMDQVLLKRRT